MDVIKVDLLAKFSADKYNKIPVKGADGLIRLLCFEPRQHVPHFLKPLV